MIRTLMACILTANRQRIDQIRLLSPGYFTQMKLSYLYLSVCLVFSLQLHAEESKPAPTVATPVVVKLIDSTNVEALKVSLNQTVTVKGKVTKTKDWDGKGNAAKGINFINLEGNQFTLLIFAADYGKFPSRPAELYLGKTLEVTGKLEVHKQKWQIKVTSPDEVKVVESAEPVDPSIGPKKS